MLTPLVGLGGSFVWGRFREYAGFGNYFGRVNPQDESVYVYHAVLRAARLGRAAERAGYNLSPRRNLQLSARYYQGLRTIYESGTTEFVYFNACTEPVSERYQARFQNRGSYGVVALGYQRRLGGGR